MLKRKLILSVCGLLLLSTSACWEKHTETRDKAYFGRNKVSAAGEFAEAGRYSKYQDKILKARHWEKQEAQHEEFERSRRIKDGIKDGSLMDQYTLPMERNHNFPG